jgi:cysteinyl-tRNA synthetase
MTVRRSAGAVGLVLALLAVVAGCSHPRHGGGNAGSAAQSATGRATATGHPPPSPGELTSWVYQLQGYPHGRLDALAAAPQRLAVIDLARDAGSSYFSAAEIGRLKASGKTVLAYFEIGSIEDFRPEYKPIRSGAKDLVLNEWSEWPGEYFTRYWDERWWTMVVKPRVDQALRAGFDGVYLDTPLAYEQITLSLVKGQSRDSMARQMADLIVRISRYAKGIRPHFQIFPQNSPELRDQPGYTRAIDGIGVEELFYQATDRPCEQDYCAENLADIRALRSAGKTVLAVDYASKRKNVADACARYRAEGFAGYVTTVDLDRTEPPCPAP